jgi:hypothetical protein
MAEALVSWILALSFLIYLGEARGALSRASDLLIKGTTRFVFATRQPIYETI